MGDQISFFDGSQKFFLDRKIRLIELFGGIGSQAKALRNIGADYDHYMLCDIDKYAVKSYNAIHGTNFEPCDITKVKGGDLGINECVRYIHLLTYSFP
jgi:DNA (cytosine-5)-methyltransferase 1